LQALALTIDFFKLIWESLKNFAKAKEVAALANSEGYCEASKAYQQRCMVLPKEKPAITKKQQNDCIFFIKFTINS
jgi:hypothetical protein